MSYNDLVSDSLFFLKCDSVTSGLYQNDGTAGSVGSSAVAPDSISGVYGNAYSFDTTGTTYGHASTSGSFIGTSDDFTFGGWFQEVDVDEEQVGMSISNGSAWADTVALSPYTRWGGSQQDRGIKVFYEDIGIGNPTLLYTYYENNDLDDGNWHWLCVEKDGTTLRLYYDDADTPVASGTVSNLGSAINHVNFGSRYHSNNSFMGNMDDAFIMTGVLTASEKSDLKNKTT